MEKYKCAYCGSEYNSPYERAVCEQKCFKKIKEEEERVKKEEAEKERKEEEAALEKKLTEILEEVEQYNKKYKTAFPVTLPKRSIVPTLLDLFW